MLRKMILSAAMVVVSMGVVHAAGKDDLSAGLQKLADSPNYSWKTTVEGGFGAGETDGQTQKDGVTVLKIVRQDNTYDIVIRDGKGVVKMDDGWKTAAELTAGDGGGGPERFMGMMVQNFRTPVSMALDAVGKLGDVKEADGVYSADLSEEAAKQMLMFRPRRQNADANGGGPAISNAKGSIKVWMKDGTITKTENHLTGTVSFNGNDRDIDRTTTTEFTDVGTTTVKVPEEADAKLKAPAATQP